MRYKEGDTIVVNYKSQCGTPNTFKIMLKTFSNYVSVVDSIVVIFTDDNIDHEATARLNEKAEIEERMANSIAKILLDEGI